MPAATAEENTATEIRVGSFADLPDDLVPRGEGESDAETRGHTNEPPATSDADASKAAADASKQTVAKPADAKPDAKPADSKPAETNTNPHLIDEIEPAKPAEKKNETDDEEIPAEHLKGMTKAAADKARETWKTIKQTEKAAISERDAARAEIATLKKQMEETGKTGPEIEALRKERDEVKTRLAEYENEIAVTRVESTPQFKAQVSAPIKASEEAARALATKYEVSAAALLDALREADPSKQADLIEELSADFKTVDRYNLIEAAKAYAHASKAGEEMRTNAGAKLEELTRQSKQEAERAATANIADFRKAATEAWKAAQEHHPIIRPVEGKEQWNELLTNELREIEAVDINQLPIEEVARGLVAARVVPHLRQEADHFRASFKKERELRQAAEKRLEEYRKTEPGAGAGATVHSDDRTSKSGSFVDAIFPES